MVNEQVSADFERALRKAFIRDLRSFFRRQSNRLISYSDVQRRITPEGQRYRGMQTVHVNDIVGSFDRFRDFDRAFLPKGRSTEKRWKSIDRAHHQDVQLPPIQLYKIGDIYFVKDGNHRVSVAREHGVEFIDAEVTEASIRVPLYSSMSPDQVLMQIEYAEFLRRTDLDRSRPEHDIRPTALGRYEEMLDHIDEYRRTWKGVTSETHLRESSPYWYDEVYMPIVLAMRKANVARHFPNRSEADGYLWVMARRENFLPKEKKAVEAEVATLADEMQFHPMDVVTTPVRLVTDAARKSVGWATRISAGKSDRSDNE